MNKIKHVKILEILFLTFLGFTIACSDKTINGRYAINFHDSIELELLKDTFNVIKVVSESAPNTDMVATWETLLHQGTYIVNNERIELFNKNKERVCVFKLADGHNLICSNNFDNFVTNDTLNCIIKYDKNNKQLWRAGKLNDSVTFKYYFKENKVVHFNKRNEVIQIKK